MHRDGFSQLLEAVQNNDDVSVGSILRFVDTDASISSSTDVALAVALEKSESIHASRSRRQALRHLNVVRLLLAANANPNSKHYRQGSRPIALDLVWNDEVASALLDAKADVEDNSRGSSKRNGQWTPLLHAVDRGLFRVVRTLLSVGANVFATTGTGHTALELHSVPPTAGGRLSAALIRTQMNDKLHEALLPWLTRDTLGIVSAFLTVNLQLEQKRQLLMEKLPEVDSLKIDQHPLLLSINGLLAERRCPGR